MADNPANDVRKQPMIQRPVRAATIAFAVMVALFVGGCVLFADWAEASNSDPMENLKAVLIILTYSFFLSFFATGMTLAAYSRLTTWLWRLAIVIVLFMVAIWLMIQGVARGYFGPGFLFETVFVWTLRAALIADIAWLLFACAVASWGWFGYFRGVKDARRNEVRSLSKEQGAE